MLRNLGASFALAIPFTSRLFGSKALAKTPVDQVVEKFGSDITLRADDKFVEDILKQEGTEPKRPQDGPMVAYNRFGRAYNRFGRAYNRFGRAYNRFGRAYNRFGR